jgi:hypothetical protein
MIDMLLIMAVMANVSQTPYDALRYNCWDYATDMRAQLRDLNITSRIMMGTLDGKPHAWLSAGGYWFDATFDTYVADASSYKFLYYGTGKFNPFKARWVASFKSTKP